MVADGAVWLDSGIANRVLSAYSVSSSNPPIGAVKPQSSTVPPFSGAPAAKPKGNVSLSPRETEVLRLVADGLSNQKSHNVLVLVSRPSRHTCDISWKNWLFLIELKLQSKR